MPSTPADSEAWKRIVLKAMPLPAWLSEDGRHRDIVLSTRVRFMRNLQGHKFPHTASSSELKEIGDKVSAVFHRPGFEILRNASPAERDYLVACRMASPDFDWRAPGRLLVLDDSKSLSVMVNEEDHLRIQALSPGWSFSSVLHLGEKVLALAEKGLEFARTDAFGYLAASVMNSGEGRRYSAMFHLIGLAHGRRLATIIRALNAQGMVVRGLFGERSRAIGAFIQISTTATSVPYFVGACEYLLAEETRARRGADVQEILDRYREAAMFIETSKGINLADALRILAWRRWASCLDPQAGLSPREIDACIPELALLESLDEVRAGRSRLEVLRRLQ